MKTDYLYCVRSKKVLFHDTSEGRLPYYRYKRGDKKKKIAWNYPFDVKERTSLLYSKNEIKHPVIPLEKSGEGIKNYNGQLHPREFDFKHISDESSILYSKNNQNPLKNRIQVKQLTNYDGKLLFALMIHGELQFFFSSTRLTCYSYQWAKEYFENTYHCRFTDYREWTDLYWKGKDKSFEYDREHKLNSLQDHESCGLCF